MSEFIQVEAVNMGGVISDTEDLSTRRAGGYMLLDLVHEVNALRDARADKLFDPVTLGASVGLFELKPGVSMDDALKAVNGVLAKPLFAQATVIVVNTRDERIAANEPTAVREALIAAVRRRQMQSLCVVTAFEKHDNPDKKRTAPKGDVCQIDGLRPAFSEEPFKTQDQTRSQSLSVTLRREEGIALRQRFYARELARAGGGKTDQGANRFTDDFDELSGFNKAWPAKSKPPALLEGKIAVLYADGNGFGNVSGTCKSWKELREWDSCIQTARQEFLHHLLQWIEAHPHGMAPSVLKQGVPTPSRLRVETLMWGGDEFLLVLPAWLALQAVQMFFKTCKIEWPAGTQRTHSVGLVMAHHNAPIAPLQALAKNLAEQGKSGQYKDQNSLNWTVLESFDHAGSDLDRYWDMKGLKSLKWDDMALNPSRLDELLATLPKLAAVLPRSSLYRIAQILVDWNAQGQIEKSVLALLTRAYANVQDAVAGDRTAWKELWKASQPKLDVVWPEPPPAAFAKPEHLNAWLTLLELWDYAQACVPSAYSLSLEAA
jgi:hypothetical protein